MTRRLSLTSDPHETIPHPRGPPPRISQLGTHPTTTTGSETLRLHGPESERLAR
jgi:hypothetical protein